MGNPQWPGILDLVTQYKPPLILSKVFKGFNPQKIEAQKGGWVLVIAHSKIRSKYERSLYDIFYILINPSSRMKTITHNNIVQSSDRIKVHMPRPHWCPGIISNLLWTGLRFQIFL